MTLKRYFRFAKEGEYGEDPQEWITYDFDNADINPPDEQYETFDSSALRTSAYAAPGPYISEGSVSVPATFEGLELIIEGVLGSFEGGINNSLPTFHMAVGKENFEHLFTGMVIDTLEITFENGFLVFSIDVVGGEDEKDNLADIGPSDLPEEVFVAVDGGFTIGTTDYTAEIQEMTLTINNNIDVDDTMPVAQRYPVMIVPQDLEIDFDLDVTFEDEEELEEFWGGSDGPTEEVEDTDIEITFDGGAGDFTIDIPRAICQDYNSEISGSEPIDQSLTYEALLDTVEGYAIYFDLDIYNLTFEVEDFDTGDPIENAEVNIDGIGMKETDENGEVVFESLDPDTYDYTVDKEGYIAEDDNIEIVDEDVIVTVQLEAEQ